MLSAESRNLSWRENWPVALAFIPPIVLALLIVRNWVNVPLLDEWWTPAVLFKDYFVNGQLSWQALIAQHNETRALVPRLIFLGCASLFGWDPRVTMVLSWISCVAILSGLIHLQRLTLPLTSRGRALLLFFLSAVLFSTNQWENWLWGIQVVIFIPALCLTAALVIQRRTIPYGWKVILCAALSFVATYSYSNGMICWLLAFPVFAGASQDRSPEPKPSPGSRRWRIFWIGIYLLLAAGSLFLYFRDYIPPANSPSIRFALEHKRMALHYLAAWIGSSFAQGTLIVPMRQATFFGGVALAGVGVALFSLWRQRRSLFTQAKVWRLQPWTVFLLYGLCSGMSATVGRLGMGMDQAIASRYIGFSAYVFVGLAGMLVVLHGQTVGEWLRRSSGRTWLSGLATGVIATCFFLDWFAGYLAFQSHRKTEEEMLITLRFLRLIPDNPLLTGVYSEPERVRQVALPLFERKILRQELVGPWLLEKIAHPDGDDAGFFTIRRAPGQVQIFGWAMLPESKIVPDCVVVSSADATGKQRLWTAFIPRFPREDVAKVTKTKALLNSGFDLTLPNTPQSAEPDVSLYAVDLGKHQVFRLKETSP
ncbi:MAG: hypothetical protein V7609_3264 [Verrucomicrobiota bacterium]